MRILYSVFSNQSIFLLLIFFFVDTKVKEYPIFIKFYGKLASVLPVATLSPHLISKNLITTSEAEELHTIATSVKKAVYVLRKISASLQAGQTQTFDIFLTIIEEYGNAASIEVLSKLKSEIKSSTGNYNYCDRCHYLPQYM